MRWKMPSEIKVLFPSGAHGHYLCVLLNELAGVPAKKTRSDTFDQPIYSRRPIFNVEHRADHCDPARCVAIEVHSSSMLKYAAVSLSRAGDAAIDVNNLHPQHVFNEIGRNPLYKDFAVSLRTIVGSGGQAEYHHLRDWARLCLFDNDFETMRMMLATSTMPPTTKTYRLEFQAFYRHDLLHTCLAILDHYGIPVCDITRFWWHCDDFYRTNPYWAIDNDIDAIERAIAAKQDLEFDPGNFLRQAWIDLLLIKSYNIIPLAQNVYPWSVRELLTNYNLWKTQ